MRFKNEYLKMRDTSKILINIASTEFMQDEVDEALRYYEHALNVLRNCVEYPHREMMNMRSHRILLNPEQVTLAVEAAKVHVSIGFIKK